MRGAGLALMVTAHCLAQSAFERGLRAFREQSFPAARRAFEEAIGENPKSARAHKWLGMAFAAEGDYASALEPARRACELDPREELACYYLGRVYYTLVRLEDSLKAFSVALKHTPDRGRVHYGMALSFEGLGRAAEAERAYQQAIRAGHRQARVDYGLFLSKHGRGAEALDMLAKAGAKAEYDRVARALQSAPESVPRAAPPPVKFEAAALPMRVRNGAAGNKHVIETMIAGVAVLDYDNDGWPDIFVPNGAEVPSLRKTDASYFNRLFRNQRDGSFSDVTAAAGLAGAGYSMGAAAADYDNDGWVDLYVTGVRGNFLYRNRGDGTFEDVTQAAGVGGQGLWAVGAGWFDYDNDGWLDLFLVNYMTWDPATELQCGGMHPGHRTYCHPRHYGALPNALYRNQRDGTFRDVSAESGIAAHRGKGMGLAFGDADGDGWLDILVSNDTLPNFLFLNLGDGRFREAALEAGAALNADAREVSAMGVDFRDYDNDGREDLFIPALSNETFSLYRNLGRGRFTDVNGPTGIAAASLPLGGWSCGLFDFNNDGWKDVFVAGSHVQDNIELTSSNRSRQENWLFVNHGGTFKLAAAGAEGFHRGAAFGDFDRDGRIDVVVTRLNDTPQVLRNVSPSAGHWLALRLAGRRSNRDAIGAWVALTTTAGRQYNRVTTAVGYAGSSSPILHFGLGSPAAASLIEIFWPSGASTRLENVAADRYLIVEE